MKASIIDFRTKSKEIVKALDRKEEVELYYHGHLKAIIKPVTKRLKINNTDSEFFGYLKDENVSVEQIMDNLRRKQRYDF